MIVAPAVLATLGSTFVFGWARPVMCDIGKLRDPRRGSAFVAAAGPVANLVVTALVAGFLLAASLDGGRSEEHTSELQSLMRNSYAVFCLKKKILYIRKTT